MNSSWLEDQCSAAEADVLLGRPVRVVSDPCVIPDKKPGSLYLVRASRVELDTGPTSKRRHMNRGDQITIAAEGTSVEVVLRGDLIEDSIFVPPGAAMRFMRMRDGWAPVR